MRGSGTRREVEVEVDVEVGAEAEAEAEGELQNDTPRISSENDNYQRIR